MKTFNTENKDLNGRPVTEEVKDVSKAIGSGLGAFRKGENAGQESEPKSVKPENKDTEATK